MEGPSHLPRLYVIVDDGTLRANGISVATFVGQMRAAGVTLLQYRNKQGAPQDVLAAASQIEAEFRGVASTLILNDRADLAALLRWGVHVGQGDLSPADARRILTQSSQSSQPPQRSLGMPIVGVSTHTDEQVRAAEASCADYVAVGPVFGTATKLDAEPVVGLGGVRRARGLTRKPLVAIGGITRENARSVLDEGADSVALIGGLFVPGESPRKVAEDFLSLLR